MAVNSPDMAAFAEKMHRYRKQAKLSLQDVADAAGMTKSHIWEMEQGRSVNPTVRAVWSIAAALGTSPADMLGFDPNGLSSDPLAAQVAQIIRKEMVKAQIQLKEQPQ